MKTLAFLFCAAFLPFAAHAGITVQALTSIASGDGQDAADLMQELESLGATTYIDSVGIEELSVKGSMTQINGAACDDGTLTYDVSFDVLDEQGNTTKSFDVDNSSTCRKSTPAADFNALMAKWGGDTLAGDCGLGHCWTTIDSISCMHEKADKDLPESYNCTVQLSDLN